MKRGLDWLTAVSVRHPWRMVAISLVVAVGASVLSSRLGFRGDFTELLPSTTAEVRDLQEIEGRAGGTGYLVVQVRGGTREDRRTFAQEAAPAIAAHQEVVRFVEWKFQMAFLAKRALLLLNADTLTALKNDLAARIAYEKQIANPFLLGLGEETAPIDFQAIEQKYFPHTERGDYLESKNGDELYLLVKATSTPAQVDFNRKLLATVRGTTEPIVTRFPQLKLAYTGAYVVRVEEDDALQADLARSVVIATILTLVIILAISRRLAVLPVVVLPVSIGIALTFAYAWLLVGHLNPVTGFLGAILIGLGIEYGLHLAMRYWEERGRLEPREAMSETLHGTFGGALCSAATNAAAFFVLVFAKFEAFKQFGKLAAFGVMATMLATYAFGPSLLFLSERMALRKPKPVRPDDPARTVWRPSTAFLLAIVAAMVLAVAGSAVVSHRVGFETNLLKLKGEGKAAELEIHIAQEMGVIMIPGVVWVDGLETAKTISAIARTVQKEDGEGNSSIAQIASLNDLLPADSERRLAIMYELATLLAKLPISKKEEPRVKTLLEMTQAQPWTEEELPIEFRRRFEPFDGRGTFVLLFPRYGLHDVNRLRDWAADLNTIGRRAEAAGVHAPILDSNRLAARIFALIRADGPLVMLLALLAVFVTIWIALKKVTHAMMVTVPLFAGMACLPGAMWLGGISLNFLNVVVLTNLLAIAVDNSVHVFHRYQEDGPGSMSRIMRHTGLTAVVATCCNTAGYASMLIARHAGLRSVGVLAMVGVFCTFLGTTILFPALIELRERLGYRGVPPERGVRAPGT